MVYTLYNQAPLCCKDSHNQWNFGRQECRVWTFETETISHCVDFCDTLPPSRCPKTLPIIAYPVTPQERLWCLATKQQKTSLFWSLEVEIKTIDDFASESEMGEAGAVIFGKHLLCHAQEVRGCYPSTLLTIALSHIIATPIFQTRGKRLKIFQTLFAAKG